MKQLTCEMCGSAELIKQDGFFVCQTCGTKYSVEEAKKMMIEGTVDVSGSTIRVDTSKELENLYELARRAKENGNSEEAAKYYDMILLKEPNDWEAAFYHLYYSVRNCTLAQMEEKLYLFANSLDSFVKLADEKFGRDRDEMYNSVKEKFEADPDVSDSELEELLANVFETFDSIRFLAYSTMARDIMQMMNLFIPNFANRAKSYSDPNTALQNYRSGLTSLQYLSIKTGDFLASCPKTQETAIKFYEFALNQDGQYKKEAVQRIKMIDPEYEEEDDFVYHGQAQTKTSSGGCYVATCVYGSYDCPQVWTLRRYRDDTLGATWYGRLFIRAYYAISPTLVKWFGNTAWFKKMWKGKLDHMVAKLQSKGVENTPYEDKNW